MDMKAKNDSLEHKLKEALYKNELPDSKIHDQILSHWKHSEHKTHSKRSFRKQLVAALCGIIFLLGSATGVVAAVQNQGIGLLSQHIWQLSDEATQNEAYIDHITKDCNSQFTVTDEYNTYQDIKIEPIHFLTDKFSYYCIFKVTGINDFLLNEQMVIGDGCFTSINKEETTSELYYLKKDGNSIYYAMRGFYENKGNDIVFRMSHFYLLNGGYEKDGWINQNNGTDRQAVCKGDYSVTLKGKAKDEQVTVQILGAQYTVYAMSLHVNRDVMNLLLNNPCSGWMDVKAWVALDDGTKVKIGPCNGYSGFAGCTNCILEHPVDVSDITGIYIGDNFYEIEK